MELLERFAQGDMDAFEALFREFQGEVYGWIVRIVRDGNAAEDLTVEAFWRMYRAHARFDPRHKSRKRKFRVGEAIHTKTGVAAEAQRDANNTQGGDMEQARTSGRAEGTRIWRMHTETDPEGSFGPWARRVATNVALDHLKKARRELPLIIDPAEEACANPGVQGEIREQIETAFGELSPKLRAVATLALVEELPYEEIAEALGISVVTVRVRVFRAVRILREQLAKAISGEGIGHRATKEVRGCEK